MTNSKDVVVTGLLPESAGEPQRCLSQRDFACLALVRKQTDADRLQEEFGNGFVPLLMDITDADAVHQAARKVGSMIRRQESGWPGARDKRRVPRRLDRNLRNAGAETGSRVIGHREGIECLERHASTGATSSTRELLAANCLIVSCPRKRPSARPRKPVLFKWFVGIATERRLSSGRHFATSSRPRHRWAVHCCCLGSGKRASPQPAACV